MRQTLGILATALWDISANDPIHPVRGLDEMAQRSPANARKGLRMAISDLVEELAGASPQEVEHLGAQLIAAGGMSVGEIRAQFSKRLRAILKRGVVRTESEYYLVRNAIEFADSKTTTQMWTLLSAFEANVADTGQ